MNQNRRADCKSRSINPERATADGKGPLTPDLSPSEGERGNRRQSFRHACSWMQHASRVCVVFWLIITLSAGAAIPSAEKLLPDDTLVVITAPDYTKLRESARRAPI